MIEPDLADLSAFAAVARARSFRRAAALRRVSPSSLSEALRRLEGRLGVRLLNRTTRSVTPTDAGAGLLEQLTPALGDVAAALDAMNDFRGSPRGTLRLNVPTVVAQRVLPPIAARFLAAYPGVTLEVATNDALIDVLAAGFDAGIRYEERIERDMIAIPIVPRVQRFVVAASPAYLKQHGTPTHPKELVEHSCIRHRFPNGVMVSPWEFERAGRIVRVTPEGPLIGSTFEIEVEGALAGLGIMCTFEDYLQPYLADGRLARILRGWTQDFSGPFLYYPSRTHMPTPLRAFVDFLKSGALRTASKGLKNRPNRLRP